MSQCQEYFPISNDQASSLTRQGCLCDDWSKVFVTENFDTSAVRNTTFIGSVLIGSSTGQVSDALGSLKPCGIYDAVIDNCTIGNHCRISKTGIHIKGYNIDDSVCIENIGRLEVSQQASFGNGVQVSVLNEAGGREVTLFDGLSAQLAYIQCLHRFRPGLADKLSKLTLGYIDTIEGTRGHIAEGARISSSDQILNVNIGQNAIINGALRLTNGTVLSSADSHAFIGADVVAKDFIIAEGASVDSGAIIEKSYIGQACEIGKGFIADNCLFFANSQMLGGEACSVFAGPYTVSHHKSTLLIAGLFSFYNAGSGTNQSNHMYRLGPSHEGKLLRGAKTGSYAYLLWPSVVGPFSSVIGKHNGFFDASDFPFSRLVPGIDGKSYVLPGIELSGCGAVRDGMKWPARDKRGKSKRDAINFDVLTPYTVRMIIKSCKLLESLDTPDTGSPTEPILINGLYLKRNDIASSLNLYSDAIELYLLDKLFDKLQTGDLSINPAAVCSDRWADIAGMLTPIARLETLWQSIDNSEIDSLDKFNSHIDKMHKAYQIDEWAWVAKKCSEMLNIDITKLSQTDIETLGKRLTELKTRRLEAITSDAQKEYSSRSQIGFGLDGTDQDIEKDFLNVKGSLEDNAFMKSLKEDLESFKSRLASIKL